MLDAAVDVRRGRRRSANTYRRSWGGEWRYALDPPGFAHGFQALKDSLVVYMVTHNGYAPERERRVSYRHVKWPLEVAAVSAR